MPSNWQLLSRTMARQRTVGGCRPLRSRATLRPAWIGDAAFASSVTPCMEGRQGMRGVVPCKFLFSPSHAFHQACFSVAVFTLRKSCRCCTCSWGRLDCYLLRRSGNSGSLCLYMQRLRRIFTGFFARLMAAGWLFQVTVFAICYCCCLDGGSANACGVSSCPASCSCQTRFGRPMPRRQQLEGYERPTAKPVLPYPDILFGQDSHEPSAFSAAACDQRVALSAAERCVSLQRLVL